MATDHLDQKSYQHKWLWIKCSKIRVSPFWWELARAGGSRIQLWQGRVLRVSILLLPGMGAQGQWAKGYLLNPAADGQAEQHTPPNEPQKALVFNLQDTSPPCHAVMMWRWLKRPSPFPALNVHLGTIWLSFNSIRLQLLISKRKGLCFVIYFWAQEDILFSLRVRGAFFKTEGQNWHCSIQLMQIHSFTPIRIRLLQYYTPMHFKNTIPLGRV